MSTTRLCGLMISRLMTASSLDERYKENILVSKRYMPSKAQDNYNNFDITNFDAKLIDDKVIISFDALNYIKYKIVRINNGKKEVINTVENKSTVAVFLCA